MSSSEFDFATSDASPCGVYLVAHEDLAAIDAAASDAGREVRVVDLHGCHDRATLLRRIGSALDVPLPIGPSWHALDRVLRDLQWLPATGYVFLFDHAGAFRAAARDEFDQLLDVFDEAGVAWAERALPFWAFFAMPDDSFDAG